MIAAAGKDCPTVRAEEHRVSRLGVGLERIYKLDGDYWCVTSRLRGGTGVSPVRTGGTPVPPIPHCRCDRELPALPGDGHAGHRFGDTQADEGNGIARIKFTLEADAA